MQIEAQFAGAPTVGENVTLYASVEMGSTGWLITTARLKPAVAQSLESYVTTQSEVYRFQVVSYFPDGGPSARTEAVIDANGGQPRILYRRDLTDLGPGFQLP